MKSSLFVPLLLCILSVNGIPAENAWETLPVFHNGRIMPLHSFARQTVKEICGTVNPRIVRLDTTEQSPPIADKIKQIIPAEGPAEGRTFQASELLLSWISEPEAWYHIPIIPVEDANYAEEMFGGQKPMKWHGCRFVKNSS